MSLAKKKKNNNRTEKNMKEVKMNGGGSFSQQAAD